MTLATLRLFCAAAGSCPHPCALRRHRRRRRAAASGVVLQSPGQRCLERKRERKVRSSAWGTERRGLEMVCPPPPRVGAVRPSIRSAQLFSGVVGNSPLRRVCGEQKGGAGDSCRPISLFCALCRAMLGDRALEGIAFPLDVQVCVCDLLLCYRERDLWVSLLAALRKTCAII